MKYWQYIYDSTNKSFYYHESNSTNLLGPTQVRLRPLRVGICGSDLRQIIAKDPHPQIGHEWVGIIDEIGEDVKDFNIKEKVISVAHIACEECEYCLEKKFQSCKSRQLLGSLNKSVLSSSITLQQSDLLKVPQNLNLNDLALLEVAFIGESAVERAQSIGLNSQNQKCLIFGAGPIGIFTALSLKHRGFNVSIVERNKTRIKIAKKVGLSTYHIAEIMINKLHYNAYDAIFDCSGDNNSTGAVNILSNYAKIKAIIVIVAKYSNAQINESIYAGKSIRLTWVSNHDRNIFEKSILFWSPIISKYTPYLTESYQIKDINQAFKDALSGKYMKNILKVLEDESS